MNREEDLESLIQSEDDDDLETLVKTPLLQHDRSNNSRYSIPLQDGKTFHLFIAHAESDNTYARGLMEDLEARFGFKCMFAERDFVAGREIVENINEKIQESHRILLILTPEFHKSYYCKQEMNQAFFLAQEENRINTVIPLLLRSDENGLPIALRSCTYIDAEKEIDIALKIHAHFCMLDDNEQKIRSIQKEISDPVEIRKQNGARLLTVSSEKSMKNKLFGIRWRFGEISDNRLQELGSESPKVRHLYRMIGDEVNRCLLLRCYGIFAFGWRMVMFGVLMAMVLNSLVFLIVLLTTVIRDIDNYVDLIIVIMISSGSVITVLCIIVCRICSIQLLERVDRCMWNLNRGYLKNTSYLVAFDRQSSFDPRISIIRYDKRDCVRYTSVLLKSLHRQISDEEIEVKTIELFDSVLWDKRREFFHWEKMLVADPSANEVNRHPTWQNKMCLCDLIKRNLPRANMDEIITV